MKNLLNKLFPNHDSGSAKTMLVMLLFGLLAIGYTFYDYSTHGDGLTNLYFTAITFTIGAGIYVFNKKD